MAIKRAPSAVERRSEVRAYLRDACRLAAPDLDEDRFADSVIALARAQRELGRDDAASVFAGALEIAGNRKKGNR